MKKSDGWAVYHECGELSMEIADKLLSMYDRAGTMDDAWRKECFDYISKSLNMAHDFWGGGR